MHPKKKTVAKTSAAKKKTTTAKKTTAGAAGKTKQEPVIDGEGYGNRSRFSRKRGCLAAGGMGFP